MVDLNYQMVLILFQVLKIISRIIWCTKKNETLTTIPSINVCINRINNRLVFKIKYKYKLDLQTPETMKSFGSTRKLIDKVEVVLVQFNLIDNQYQQKSEVLYTFAFNKSYAYLLNVEPRY